MFYRFRYKRPLRRIKLEDEHCVEVVGLLAPLLYVMYIWYKAALNLVDAAVLTSLYVVYLFVLSRVPPKEAEGIEDLELVPRTIVKSPRRTRHHHCPVLPGGGMMIYFAAEPFLGSLLAISAALGIPSFVFVQWVRRSSPSFQRSLGFLLGAQGGQGPHGPHEHGVEQHQPVDATHRHAARRLFHQPGEPSTIPFDEQQQLELLMTIGQSLVGMFFLINMELAWWEAGALFGLWESSSPFLPYRPGQGSGDLGLPHPLVRHRRLSRVGSR